MHVPLEVYLRAPSLVKKIQCITSNYLRTGPNFMALLTVSTESALTEAGNSVLTASVFHGLAAKFGTCT